MKRALPAKSNGISTCKQRLQRSNQSRTQRNETTNELDAMIKASEQTKQSAWRKQQERKNANRKRLIERLKERSAKAIASGEDDIWAEMAAEMEASEN